MNDLPGLLRRVGAYSGLLGATLLFVGDLLGKGNLGVISYIGIVLGVLSFLLGIVFSLRKRSFGWILLLVAVGVISVAAGVGGIGATGSIDLINTFMPISFIGYAACLSQQTDVTERSVIATLGLIALLTIIISGTFAGGGGIGSNTDPKVYQLNLHMYAIAGFLALIAWLLAIINTFRIQAWGWFATSLLVFGIGALMFGLFGPTAEDVRQSRLQRAARRAAGVR
ncbi:MAG TPA: hypothetical protein VH349_03575 [Ktedonobacterales bacterium]|jgi:hypothetical protein